METTILINREAIQKRITEMGAQISRDHAGQELLVVCILKGAFMFTADLMRSLDVATELEFMSLKSYEGTASTGHIQVTADLTRDIGGRNVLILEDIVDTGHTVTFLRKYLGSKNPRSLKFCTLLSKPEVHQGRVSMDYVGFDIPKAFVIGYGLDLDGQFRGVPDLLQVLTPP